MHCSYLPTPVPKRNVAKEILDIVQPTIKLILIERIDALEMLKSENTRIEVIVVHDSEIDVDQIA